MSSWNSDFTPLEAVGQPVRNKKLLTGFTPSEIRRQRRLTVARGNLSLAGFTLIETIVALAILSLIFLDMAQIIKIGYSAGSKSKKYVTACSLAREKLEEKSSWLPASESRAAVSGFSGFEREVTVSNHATYPATLKQILVTVYWDSGASSVSFTTLKADY